MDKYDWSWINQDVVDIDYEELYAIEICRDDGIEEWYTVDGEYIGGCLDV